MHNYFFAATICTFTLIYAVTRGNVDDQHHTMARPLPPCSGNPKSLASYVMEFFFARGGRRPRPMGIYGCPHRRELGTTAAATEYFLHSARCMVMRRGEHGSGCGTPHARPTGDARAWTCAVGSQLSFAASLAV